MKIENFQIHFAIGILSMFLVAKSGYASEWTVFSDKTDGVAFDYPKSWVIKPQRTGAFRIMVGPENGIQNCTLVTHTVPQIKNMTTEDVIRATSKQDIINGANQKGSALKIFDFKVTKIGNRYALFYESETDYQSLNVKINFRSLNVMTKAEDRVYLFTCTSIPEDIQKNKARYTHIVSSLTLRF